MALQILGAGFDIHGGGDDLVFPHHENERAEASGTGQPFARTWIHNGMVQVSGEKMSKSLGNFTTLAEVLERYDARALRLLILQTHYRKTMEINGAALDQSAAAIDRLDAMARRARAAGIDLEAKRFVDELVDALPRRHGRRPRHAERGRGHLRRAATSQRGARWQRPRRGAGAERDGRRAGRRLGVDARRAAAPTVTTTTRSPRSSRRAPGGPRRPRLRRSRPTSRRADGARDRRRRHPDRPRLAPR